MLQELLVLNMTAFILTFARLGSAIMIMPGVGDSFVSTRVRLMFAMTFSFVMMPLVSTFLTNVNTNGITLYVLIMMEVVIGIFIGSIARIFMATLDTAGMIISIHSGLSNAQMFNPSFAAQGSIIGAFLSVTGVVLLFVSNLYSILIYGLYQSYYMFPIGVALVSGDLSEVIVRAISVSFATGIQIAAPFMIVSFLLYVGMGVLARLMPQIQVFILSLPIQILLSLLTMTLVISAMMMFWLQKYEDAISFFYSN